MLTPYWFLPLPLALGVAGWTRRREVGLGCGLGAALWASLYGGQFLPHLPVANAAGPTFKVMTYNMLDSNLDSAAVIGALRAGQAGVVALQWVMRIDYVFCAGSLAALSAQAGPWDGARDHQALVVELALTK